MNPSLVITISNLCGYLIAINFPLLYINCITLYIQYVLISEPFSVYSLALKQKTIQLLFIIAPEGLSVHPVMSSCNVCELTCHKQVSLPENSNVCVTRWYDHIIVPWVYLQKTSSMISWYANKKWGFIQVVAVLIIIHCLQNQCFPFFCLEQTPDEDTIIQGT